MREVCVRMKEMYVGGVRMAMRERCYSDMVPNLPPSSSNLILTSAIWISVQK